MRVKPGRDRLTVAGTKAHCPPKKQFTWPRPGRVVWYMPVGSQHKERCWLFVTRLLDSALASVRSTGLFRA
jgi:hypothetical protein